MKKLIASLVIIAAFTFYAVFSRGATTAQGVADRQVASSGASSTTVTSEKALNTAAEVTVGSSSSSSSSGSGSGLKDGTYKGSGEDVMYGTVQVAAVIQNGQLTNVQILNHPSGRRQSDQINSYALPILTKEAVQAQSANVQTVSGATLTSMGFTQSLDSALQQAAS